jgi:mono/diheme cytochrome c family protein
MDKPMKHVYRIVNTAGALAVAAALALGLAACGGATAPSTPAPTAGPSPTPTPLIVLYALFGTPTPTPTLSPARAKTATAFAQTRPDFSSLQSGGAVQIKLLPGDVNRGALVFAGVGTCSTCHDTRQGITIVGPSLRGIAERAGTRVPDQDADTYLHNSILNPKAFVVPGFNPVMPETFNRVLNPQQIEDLVAYLKTLK